MTKTEAQKRAEKKYREKNRDAKNVYSRAYYDAHRTSLKEKRIAYRSTEDNKELRRVYSEKVAREHKVCCIRIKGGACNVCGVKYGGKNAPIFQFHHTDPTTKLYTVAHMAAMSKEVVEAEVEKCEMLCANCHATKHAGEY